MKALLTAVFSLVLAACAASSARIEPARLNALQAGKTTFDDVVRQFGKPSVISRNVDGTQTAIYLYAPEGESGTTMVTLVSTSPADSTTFYFDTGGVLTDYKTREAKRTAPAPSTAPAAAQAAPAAQPAGAKPGVDKPVAAAPAPEKKPSPPGVTGRWPGSTTENR